MFGECIIAVTNSKVNIDGIGLDLLSGTGVATAVRIVQWPTLSLIRPCPSRLGIIIPKENPLQGYHWCESINSNLIENVTRATLHGYYELLI